VSGKSTLAETPQRYGFAKAADLSLTKPLSNISTVGSGLRDIAAGRYFSAKPTDVAIRDAFRMSGPAPDFRAPVSAMPRYERPALRLEANVPGNAEVGQPGIGGGLLPHEGQAGIPIPPAGTVTPAPRSLRGLPASTAPGFAEWQQGFERTFNKPPTPRDIDVYAETHPSPEAQPMIRYRRPYVEPPEPSTIRPMPPQKFPALPQAASAGEVQPYIAHRSIASGPSGEATRIAPPQFMAPSEPLPSALRIAGKPLPEGAEGPTQGIRTAPRGLLNGGFGPNEVPPATRVEVFPAGSAHRGLPVDGTQMYPPGSQFRPKIAPFDIDEYLRNQTKPLVPPQGAQ
jgi:hypothetical protein